MTYSNFLNKLQAFAEPDFAIFQKRLIFTNRQILGVRTPTLRKIAKDCARELDDLLAFPNEYYETVFIKLTAVSLLPYEQFVKELPKCVDLIDNWALCDSFKAKCIKGRKDEFLTVLDEIFARKTEFSQRYVLVVLLSEYVEEKYRQTLKRYIFSADTQPCYVHMAVAWLTAELLVKDYGFGLELLKEGRLPVKTYNKVIQKAVESYRITKEQKEYLRSLKIKQER